MPAASPGVVRLSPLELIDTVEPPAIPAPWSHTPDLLHRWVQQQVPHEGMSLWLTGIDNPATDELLASSGIRPAAILDWTLKWRRRDRLFQRALREGISVGRAAEPETFVLSHAPGAHVVYHLNPESLQRRRWWVVTLSRKGREFTEGERQAIELMGRQWQASFNRPAEPGVFRLLVGADDRLIHADPACRRELARLNVAPAQALHTLRALRNQRWPEADDEPHDAVIDVGGRDFWAVFRRSRGANLPGAWHWHVQLRPLAGPELPPVEELADARLARALAHIHDRFADGPNLRDLSQAAAMSPYHFQRMFTKQVGVSPARYVTMKRLQVARWLLRATRAPIGRIATAVGFAGQAHFASAFRRATGQTPRDYRLGEEPGGSPSTE